MDLKFNNLKELYDLLQPALETKKIQLKRNDYLGVSKKDIWNYLKDTIWVNACDLHLYQMVSDILHADNDKIISYNEYR